MERVSAEHGGYGIKTSGKFLLEGMRAVVRLLDAPYEKGVKVGGKEKRELEQLKRNPAKNAERIQRIEQSLIAHKPEDSDKYAIKDMYTIFIRTP